DQPWRIFENRPYGRIDIFAQRRRRNMCCQKYASVFRKAGPQALSERNTAAIPVARPAPPKVEIVHDEQIYRAQPRRQDRARLAGQLLSHRGYASEEGSARRIHGKELPRSSCCQSSLPAPHSTRKEEPFPGRERPVDPRADGPDGWVSTREGIE